MKTNTLPHFDASVNETGCCPRFDPTGWDGAELHFRDKPFVRAETRSVLHIPIDMGQVFDRVLGRIDAQMASDPDQTLVLSRDLSNWKAEHLFAVKIPVDGEEMTTLSGDFRTRVFEGPYRMARDWYRRLEADQRARRGVPGLIYFFYTTCPKCAKAYGKNYVIGVYEV